MSAKPQGPEEALASGLHKCVLAYVEAVGVPVGEGFARVQEEQLLSIIYVAARLTGLWAGKSGQESAALEKLIQSGLMDGWNISQANVGKGAKFSN